MFQIESEELAWDWTQNKSNYIDIRARKNAAAQGRAWELESVMQLEQPTLFRVVDQGGPFGPGPSPAPDGGTTSAGYAADGQKPAETVQYEDNVTLFANMPGGIAKFTRIRADLDHTALDRDLTLQASTDQTVVDRTRQVTKELNEPLCPVYDGCESTTSAPRSQAIAKTTETNDDGCATTTRRPSGPWIAHGLGALGFALARRKKKTS
jgi:hypothetical protein